MCVLSFRVTQQMVDRFAELTGDRSSLHTDESFARRSPFRRRVVHGMLPVMYLSRCEELQRRSKAIEEFSVRFHKPAFPGDELALTVSECPSSSSSTSGTAQAGQAFEYTITRMASEETLTAGTIRLDAEKDGEIDETGQTGVEGATNSAESTPGSIVPEALEERVAVFDDLAKGETASFPVRISGEHIQALREILAIGRRRDGQPPASRALERLLLTASSSSTYVGMCMPGRFATFTELTVTAHDVPTGDTSATFQGEVAFLSASTQMAVSKFTVAPTDTGRVAAQGQIKARVGDPPTTMPSMDQVQEQSAELGLRDRVVLVTGASRGLGETVAKMFGAHGAHVVVNYHHGREDANRVASEIVEAGGDAVPMQADVSDLEAVWQLLEETTRKWGPVEVLVNNAVSGYEARSFQDLQWADVQRDLDVILKGAFNCCQAVLPSMVEHEFGRIVNMSTTAVENPPTDHAGYVTAKCGLLGLTRSLAVEYADDGIRVNAVMPGMVQTDLTSNLSPMDRKAVRQDTPMGRLAEPLEVAQAVVYLASNWSSFTTGQQLAISGGQPPFH